MKLFVVLGLILVGWIGNLPTVNSSSHLWKYSYDPARSQLERFRIQFSRYSEGQSKSTTDGCESQEAIAGMAISSAVGVFVILLIGLMIVVAGWKLYQRVRKRSTLYEII
jgi:hypothetical protein